MGDFHGFGSVNSSFNGFPSRNTSINRDTKPPAIWLAADFGVTKDANNYVSAVSNKGFDNFSVIQNTLGKKPLWREAQINGKPVFEFYGLQHLSASFTRPISQPFTVIMVANMFSNTQSYNVFYDAQTQTTNRFTHFFQYSDSKSYFNSYYNSTSPASTFGYSENNPTSAYLHKMVVTGETSKLFKNNTLKGIISVTLPLTWLTFRLGAGFSESAGLNGQIAEILIIETAQETVYEQYLKEKYNLY